MTTKTLWTFVVLQIVATLFAHDRSPDFYDVVILSGMYNMTFAANRELTTCVDDCSDDYHAMFVGIPPDDEYDFPLNPLFYGGAEDNDTFGHFCAVERHRRDCIQRQCGATVWISGLRLCNDEQLQARFLQIANSSVIRNFTGDEWHDGVFGVEKLGGHYSSGRFIIQTAVAGFKRQRDRSNMADFQLYNLNPLIIEPYTKWIINVRSIMPPNYYRTDPYPDPNKPVYDYGCLPAVNDSCHLVATAKLLATGCQILLTYAQVYRRLMDDKHGLDSDNGPYYSMSKELLAFLAEQIIAPYAQQLDNSARHTNLSWLLSNTTCLELTNPDFNRRQMLPERHFEIEQRYAEKLEREKKPNIKVRGEDWGRSRPVLRVVVDWKFYDVVEYVVMLANYIQHVGFANYAAPTYSILFDSATNFLTLTVWTPSGERLMKNATSATCTGIPTCAVSIWYDTTDALRLHEAFNVSLKVGVTSDKYQFDYLWRNGGFNATVDATTAAADPEVLLLLRTKSMECNCSSFCFLKAFSRVDGLDVYSTKPTCQRHCNVTNQQELPFRYDPDKVYQVGFPNIRSDGEFDWWVNPDFFSGEWPRDTCGVIDTRSFDWLSGVLFTHDRKQISATHTVEGQSNGYVIFKTDIYFETILDIAVDPLRSRLVLLCASTADQILLSIGLRRIHYRMTNQKVELVSVSNISLSNCGFPTGDGFGGTMTLDWYELPDADPLRHDSQILFVRDENLFTIDWEGHTCERIFTHPNVISAQNMAADRRFIYFCGQTVGYDSFWARLDRQQKELLEMWNVSYTSLNETKFVAWNFQEYLDGIYYDANLTLPNYQQYIEETVISKDDIYAILPYNSYNYPMPDVECLRWQLQITVILREDVKLLVEVELGWLNCESCSRPPIYYTLQLQAIGNSSDTRQFTRGPTYDLSWAATGILVTAGSNYTLVATATTQAHYIDRSCDDEWCQTMRNHTSLAVPERKTTVVGGEDFAAKNAADIIYSLLTVTIIALVCLVAFVTYLNFARRRQRRNVYGNLRKIPARSLTLGDEIGHGNFGSVFAGTIKGDRGEESKVAVKILKRNCSKEDRRRFQDEVLLLASLHHRNVLKSVGIILEGYWQEEKFVTKLINGGSLLSFLKETENVNSVRMEELLTVLTDVSRGLAYLHSERVIHNDLAARNCLVRTRLRCRQLTVDRVVLADFGLAKRRTQTEYTSFERVCPVNISSPEVLSSGVYSNASDCWMFGCLVWQVLNYGIEPWTEYNGDPPALVDAVVYQRRTLPVIDQAPLVFTDVIQRCCQYETGARPTAEEVTNSLQEWRRSLTNDQLILPWTIDESLLEGENGQVDNDIDVDLCGQFPMEDAIVY